MAVAAMTMWTSAANLALSGEGTAGDPYLITSTADWNSLADYMSVNTDSMGGKYIRITADLDFTGALLTPLGSEGDVAFKGDLDGSDKTLTIEGSATDMYSGGLITATGDGANIHDFTVAGSYSIGYTYGGTVVGLLNNSTLSNVTVTAEITASKSYCGGIAGFQTGGEINGCTFAGTLSGAAASSGGIVGSAYNALVTGCVNKGTFAPTSVYNGGIVGYAYNGTEVAAA